VARKRFKNKGRRLDGILLLDKPIGLTSNAALQQVKHLFRARKAGHTGSLDPQASGLLPICFGEATKLSAYLLESDKAYEGTCKLGVITRTADAEGEVVETRPVAGVDEARVREVLASFLGEIQQIPPMHSAVKVNGQPLYKLAHQGLEIEREPRTVHIYELEMTRLEGDELDIRLRCSKGTYVRALAEEIGTALGCGAHLSALRRTQAGPFHIEDAVSLAELEHEAEADREALDAHLLPMETALEDWPAVRLSDNSTYYLTQGQPVLVPQAPTSGWVRLYQGEERFLGVGQVLDDGRIAPRRLVGTGGRQ